MTSRAWATLACVVLAAACPAAIAVQGQPLWVVVLSALGTGAAAGAGWLGLRRPGDSAPPEPERPLYQRHLPLALLCALPLSACSHMTAEQKLQTAADISCQASYEAIDLCRKPACVKTAAGLASCACAVARQGEE